MQKGSFLVALPTRTGHDCLRSVKFKLSGEDVASCHPFSPSDRWVLVWQGPGKRPAVFSHDKLIWELCDDALEAHRIQNGTHLASPCVCPGTAGTPGW